MGTQAAAVVEQPGTRSDRREQVILDTALDLVTEFGYERMTMDVLAARARASKATIYRRWPGKAQVIAEAVRRRACPAMAEPPDTGTLRGDLLAALGQQRDKLTGEDGPLLTG
ncbi:MAG: TetR/AcrR family transcriptional regulator, partial [Pseudonocardiaceae bacterium]